MVGPVGVVEAVAPNGRSVDHWHVHTCKFERMRRGTNSSANATTNYGSASNGSANNSRSNKRTNHGSNQRADRA